MEGHLCRPGVQRQEYRYERTPEFSLPLPLNFHSLAVCDTQHSHFWLAWNEEWICLDSQTLVGSLPSPCLDPRRCLMSPRKQLQFFTPPGNPPHKIHPSLLAAPVFLVINFPVSYFFHKFRVGINLENHLLQTAFCPCPRPSPRGRGPAQIMTTWWQSKTEIPSDGV